MGGVFEKMSKLSRAVSAELIGPQVGDRVRPTPRVLGMWQHCIGGSRGGIVTEVGHGYITIKLKNKVGWNKDGARPGFYWYLWPGEYEVIGDKE